MPAVSQKQFRFMAAVAHGGIRKPGLSPAKAEEFIHGVNYKALPQRHRKRGLPPIPRPPR